MQTDELVKAGEGLVKGSRALSQPNSPCVKRVKALSWIRVTTRAQTERTKQKPFTPFTKRTERAARPTGAAAHSTVTGKKPLDNAQKVAESRRAPLLTLPESDRQSYFDKCREAQRSGLTSARKRSFARHWPRFPPPWPHCGMASDLASLRAGIRHQRA